MARTNEKTKSKPARTSTNSKMTKKNNKTQGSRDGDRRLRRGGGGPRLPTAFKKEMDLLNPKLDSDSESGSEGGDAADLYEFEEEVPQEELKKNRRYDEVDNFEYELPEDFKDEEVESDEGEEEDDEIQSDESSDKHLRMLEGITGMPKEAFDDERKKEEDLSLHHADVSGQPVSVHDLLAQLQGKSGYSNLRKRVGQLEKKPLTIQPPLPKSEQDKIQRKVSDKLARKEITKWENLVKRNREAPTLYFEQDLNMRNSTVGSIANDFVPRTDFEKKIAELARDKDVVDAYQNDGAKLLELNKVSVEDVMNRQNQLAKMRSLLFRHELKAKRIKKIKSKTYHKILKKDRMKAEQSQLEMMDPEAAKENARKLELKRAEERLTLKHKNSSKWAKRILKRGLDAQDDATRAAFSEQLQKHEELKRKMNSTNDGSSSSDSDESSEDEDYESNGEMSKDRVLRVLDKASKKTKGVLEGDDELPKTGVFALPFMERGMKKRQEEAYNEARQALEDYDETLKQLQGEKEEEDSDRNPKSGNVSGKRSFGPVSNNDTKRRKVVEREVRESDSEEEEERESDEAGPQVVERESEKSKGVDFGTALLDDEQVMNRNSVFKNMNEMGRETGPKATYEVAVFAGGSFKKVKANKQEDSKKSRKYTSIPPQDSKEKDSDQPDPDSDSDAEMVEGFLDLKNPESNSLKNQESNSLKNPESYSLPSQSSLIQRAFAGDDVESEFQKDKQDLISVENPEPEAPVLLPGWGQWAHVQKKKGLPGWMVKEHEERKREREEEVKRRKDARFKNVVISEGVDKKADKLMARSLPFPFTSREVYEQSIRMPIGPDFNPLSATSALIRPEVVKKPGLIIKPIQYEEVDPHEKIDEPQRIIQGAKPKGKSKGKGKSKKGKTAGGKQSQKASAKK
ncbi:hypothetical protein LUZ60_013924 [Juncus effusus]|nr:hypothetical protein LUZ60_013924 [Juncus effusus]